MTELLSKASEYQSTYRIIGRAHYIAADRYAAFNRFFGVPVIIITASVGTTIFVTFETEAGSTGKIIIGLISLVGAVLASLQTSLGFADTAQKHKTAGESYRTIGRRFEIFQLRYAEATSEHRPAALAELEALIEKLAELPKEFPSVPDRCYARASRECRKEKNAGKAPT